jgi:hypothetical protein
MVAEGWALAVAIDKIASRAWRAKIRDVLNQVWDPIGGCPEDEYDRYVGKVAAMIRDNATDDELREYLEWVESEWMGFARFNRERAVKVVVALRALGATPASSQDATFATELIDRAVDLL